MSFNDYQQWVASKMRPGPFNQQFTNMTIGVAGESGELLDHLKKYLFHDKPLDRPKVIKELGDILFYVAGVANALEVPLDEVADQNVWKLNARYPAGFDSTRSHASGETPAEERQEAA